MSTRLVVRTSLAIAGLVGCITEPDEIHTSSTAGLTFEEFKARTYREPSGVYVLDWDTPVFGDDELYKVWEATQQGALAVFSQNGADIKWDATQKKNLTYCVSNTFGTNKQLVIDAMKFASDNGWEKLADVNFIYVSAQDGNCTANNNAVLFDVNPTQSGGQYLARAFFPNTGRSERNVLVDTAAFQPGGTGGVPFANIIAHELGHALGFRHEHIRPEANATNCIEDNQYRGLTTYDAASVMHYPQCNGTSTNLSFTARDQQGIVALYGAPAVNTSPMAQVSFPMDQATVPPSFDVQAAIVDTDLVKAELFVDGALAGTLMTGPFTFKVMNLSLGRHMLDIRATDGAGQTATRTLTVNVAQNGGGSGTGSGGGTGTGGGEGDEISGDVYGGCNAGSGSNGALLVVMLGVGFVWFALRRRC